MSDTVTIPSPSNESGIEALRSEVQTLRAALAISLLLVFVFSICVNVFLFRQARTMGAQAGQAQFLVKSFENGGAAQAMDFWVKMNDYARTHPDFQPIVAKYAPTLNAEFSSLKKK